MRTASSQRYICSVTHPSSRWPTLGLPRIFSPSQAACGSAWTTCGSGCWHLRQTPVNHGMIGAPHWHGCRGAGSESLAALALGARHSLA